jgi:hypothetical protein
MKTLMALVLVATISMPAIAQKVSGSTATSVSAEVTKGKLSPEKSKPGDQVMLKLKDDVKSNGEVVLKKGSTITGVVKSVNRAEAKGSGSAEAQSMMEIEWLAPSQTGRPHSLMLAVQSVLQVSPMSSQSEGDDWGVAGGASAASSGAVRSGGGLLGGSLGAVSNVSASLGSTTAGVAQSNTALLSMPSVVAADARTATALESNLGLSGGSQLFQTGRGQIVTSGGSKHSLDIFSHMNNDTVITSPSRNFEITSGAQMQLLVGMKKN